MAVSSETRARIMEAVAKLPPREGAIITMRYGLLDGERHTLEYVGQHLNLTRERIRQIEQKALRKLRHPAIGRGLRQLVR